MNHNFPRNGQGRDVDRKGLPPPINQGLLDRELPVLAGKDASSCVSPWHKGSEIGPDGSAVASFSRGNLAGRSFSPTRWVPFPKLPQLNAGQY